MEILGKTNIHFKVCSAPKRDMARDEIDKSAEKRKSEVTTAPLSKRPSKIIKMEACVRDEDIKTESFAGAGGPSTPPSLNTAVNDDQSVTITFAMPNRESMSHVLRCAYNEVTGMCARNKQTDPTQYLKYARNIAKFMGESY